MRIVLAIVREYVEMSCGLNPDVRGTSCTTNLHGTSSWHLVGLIADPTRAALEAGCKLTRLSGPTSVLMSLAHAFATKQMAKR